MRTLLVIIALTFGISLAWCDNTAGGGDMPWDGDDGDGGEPTAIETPRTPDMYHTPDNRTISINPSTDNLYDLQGRKVTNPQPGKIYICRGKKIIWTKQ